MSRIKNANWNAIEDGTLEDVMNQIETEYKIFVANATQIIKEAKEKRDGRN